jgi:serine/threonine protein kinase
VSSLPQPIVDHLREAIAIPDLSGTRYRFVERIGQGGMGTVFLVEDAQLNRRVAMKILDEGVASDAARRMWREAQIIAQLEHPGIIPIHDAGTLPDGRVYYTMKFIRGCRLDDYAARAGVNDLLRVLQRICETVAFAHARGVIHRDLKPENIMVGSFGEVLVLDWGVAKVITDTGCGTVAGTPGYMAPEQAAGKAEMRSDVYGLGCILSNLLATRRPGARLKAIAEMACAASPESRYSGPAELSADIDHFLAGEPVAAYRENLWEAAVRIAVRHKTIIALVAAYLVMRAALFYFLGR